MNIAIIGATGMVGARTAAEAISRGHQVDAYTRSGKAPEGTTAHSIDLADTAALVDVVTMTSPLSPFLQVAAPPHSRSLTRTVH